MNAMHFTTWCTIMLRKNSPCSRNYRHVDTIDDPGAPESGLFRQRVASNQWRESNIGTVTSQRHGGCKGEELLALNSWNKNIKIDFPHMDVKNDCISKLAWSRVKVSAILALVKHICLRAELPQNIGCKKSTRPYGNSRSCSCPTELCTQLREKSSSLDSLIAST